MKCIKCNIEDVVVIPNRDGNLRILISPKICPSTAMVMGSSSLKPGESVAKHIHDYSDEIFYVIEGHGYLRIEEENYTFQVGDAVYIPKGTPHEIVNSGIDNLRVVFCVSPLAPSPELGHREL